ncbi:hypothetical protein NEMBOFW57_000965 [Staphylotrichum longicolle]|uniref:Protein PBN1 n=1 Tax=Staphylotrichum longicolle TaxID=669026 RepID=A0AAD4HXH8_9PEZI|nr:hypothetical protein NEMBOFW57_000965 [Staphylotrichum longicolle]
MRERITYVQKLGDSLEPSAITVNAGTISGPEVHAVREDRLTFALDELPSELRTLLTGTQDLHLRWVSTTAYETESFTSLPKERFSHSAAFQYYQKLDSLSPFIQYAKDQLCQQADASCTARLDSLSKAGSLDISYDTVQHVLRVTALWPYQRQQLRAATSHRQVRTEVGILSTDKPQTLEPHEIGISGLLTVLARTRSPRQPCSASRPATATPSRPSQPSFSPQRASIQPCNSVWLLTAPIAGGQLHPYAYLTLPRTVFADKYQLSDPLFLASKNLTALRYSTQPVDLEAPEYVMTQWGSSVLLQLAPPRSERETKAKADEGEWTAEIPLHLRYLSPEKGGYSAVDVPYPAVFWACEAGEGVAFPPNPFEKGNLGYDGLFDEGTVFWHVEPRPVGAGRRW